MSTAAAAVRKGRKALAAAPGARTHGMWLWRWGCLGRKPQGPTHLLAPTMPAEPEEDFQAGLSDEEELGSGSGGSSSEGEEEAAGASGQESEEDEEDFGSGEEWVVTVCMHACRWTEAAERHGQRPILVALR